MGKKPNRAKDIYRDVSKVRRGNFFAFDMKLALPSSIIDIHTHPPYKVAEDPILSPAESLEEMLQQMDNAAVSISGLLGHCVDPGKSAEEVRAVNTFSHEILRLCPNRFFGFVFINPNLPTAVVAEELDHWLSQPEFCAVKLEFDTNCRSPKLDVVMERARTHDAVVLHHSWYLNPWAMSPEYRQRQSGRSESHDIADLARRFPDVRIVMAHLEGSGVRGILDVADLENVWIDTSGSHAFTGTLEYAIRIVGSQRLIYGSDVYGRSQASQIGRILGAGLSAEEQADIFHRNARQVFKLPTAYTP